jgi:hypothetical protein
MTHEQNLAVQAFKDGQKRIFGLTGPSMAAHRQTIMQLATGRKVPQSKCGIHALTCALSLLDPTIRQY